MQQPPVPPGKRQIHLNIPPHLSAVYANAVMISQNKNEIFLDFAQILPNDFRAQMQSRVAMTPVNAKLFLRALQQNIETYEKHHGEIELPQQPATLADQLFGGVQKPETDNESEPPSNE